jgi:membrane protein DedA with SNARE-associated domain
MRRSSRRHLCEGSSVLQAISEFVQSFILDIGYLGIFALMVLESTMIPVPSMLVMPFAGYLAQQGHFSLPLVIAMNSAGAIVGSFAFYWLGALGGKPLLLRYGKYCFVKKDDIDKTEAFFARRGGWTVFIARLLPVVRHFISLVAGIARMRMPLFLLQTVLGATLWGGFLAVLGYQLGANWEGVVQSMKRVDLIVGVLILGLAVYFFLRHRKRVLAQRAGKSADEAIAEPAKTDI